MFLNKSDQVELSNIPIKHKQTKEFNLNQINSNTDLKNNLNLKQNELENNINENSFSQKPILQPGISNIKSTLFNLEIKIK